MPRLRRVDCADAGLRRRRRGRGFEYLDELGRKIDDAKTLARIRELRIPPAWQDVWICTDPLGHLQATGIDSAGRKQYLYHEQWRRRRDQQKFDETLDFARALPGLRRTVKRDLGKESMTRDQILACAVRLLDLGLFRIGSEEYAESNGSFGLATMRKKHVNVNGRAITFDYRAKGGIRRVQTIEDAEVRPVVAGLKRRRGGGHELLAYRNGRGWCDVSSSDINEYLKEATGGDFSAKHFRTWNGTVLAAVAVAEHDPAASKTGRKRVINEAVKGVAFFLGNTPAISRKSYIDPRVFDRYLSGWTIGDAVGGSRRKIEKAVIDLITEPARFRT
jgi:DNA topoisomerase IB